MDHNLKADRDPEEQAKPATLDAACWQLLPYEIVMRIASAASLWARLFKADLTNPKFGLGAFGLVSRYWAQFARPLLFQTLDIRSSGDVNFLYDILTSSRVDDLGPLSTYIRIISYTKTGDLAIPWIRLCTVFQHIPQVEFNLEASNLRSFALIHCMPRTLPPSLFKPCITLQITRCAFWTITQAIQLARTFPPSYNSYKINYIQCSHIYSLHVLTPQTVLRRIPKAWIPSQFDIVFNWWRLPHSMQAGHPFPDSLDLATQYYAACSMVAAKERLAMQPEHWERTRDSVLALFTPSYQLNQMAIKKNDQGIYFAMKFRVDAFLQDGGLSVHVELSLLRQLSDGVEHTSAHNIRGDLSRYCKNPQITVDWAAAGLVAAFWTAFEERVLRFEPVPLLHVVFGDLAGEHHSWGYTEVLKDIIRGNILGRINREDRLLMSLSRDGPKVTLNEIIEANIGQRQDTIPHWPERMVVIPQVDV